MGVLRIALPPGPIQSPPVVVGDLVRDEDDIDPVGLQELRERFVVSASGLHGTDDLPGAGGRLVGLQPCPESLEVGPGVGDVEALLQDPGVGEAHLRHVLPLRDVDADEEPIPIRSQRLLQFPKALDSDCI